MSYHLKLKKALSYCGAVTATKQAPDVFVEDRATADAAVASGYFELLEGGEDGAGGSKEITGHLDRAQLEDMKMDDLKQLAEDMGLDTKGLKKAQLVEAIANETVTADAGDNGSGGPATFDPETLAELELDDLTAYAAQNGISLEGVPMTKEDVLAAICAASGGSYTVIDLMKA